jgi:hypothetical protein
MNRPPCPAACHGVVKDEAGWLKNLALKTSTIGALHKHIRIYLYTFGQTPVKRGSFPCPVDETRALRTNRIWSKGRVEYTMMADTKRSVEPASETFVPLLFFVVKPFVLFCG